MADWDQNSPEDSDIVSQYPANARAARAAVRTNFGVDHHEQNDDDVGKHEVIQFVAQASTPTIEAGQVGIWNEGGLLKTRVGAGAVGDLGPIPSGTVMLFYQASPPVGWSNSGGGTSGRLFNLVTVPSGDGGTSTANSWTISGFTVAGHALTIAQMPSHNHGGLTGNRAPTTNNAGTHAHRVFSSGRGGLASSQLYPTFTRTASATYSTVSEGNVSGNIGTQSDGSHNHTVSSHNHAISSQGSGSTHSHGISHNGNWRPPVNNVIRAQKD